MAKLVGMVGMLQIMIYLLSIYLVYKGVEIFQIAFVSPPGLSRIIGMIIGTIATVSAIAVGICAIIMEEAIAKQMTDQMNKIPKF